MIATSSIGRQKPWPNNSVAHLTWNGDVNKVGGEDPFWFGLCAVLALILLVILLELMVLVLLLLWFWDWVGGWRSVEVNSDIKVLRTGRGKFAKTFVSEMKRKREKIEDHIEKLTFKSIIVKIESVYF